MKLQPSSRPFIWTLTVLALVTTLALVLALLLTPQLFTFAGTPPPPPGDDWPTYLHDIQRTSASGEVLLSPSNAGQLTRVWRFKTGGGIAASPIVANNTVYIGSWDGYEYALDALTGYLKWRTYLGKTTGNCVPPVIGITSSATVEHNVVYVGGGDSYWYALDAYTGNVLWRVFTGDNSPDKGFYNWSSPLIYKDNAYIGVASNCDNPLVTGKLLKVSLSTHQVVGSTNFVNEKEVGGGIWTSPTLDVATNTIYVTTGTQNQIWQTLSQAIVALDATTMQITSSWQIPLSQSGGDYDWGNSAVLLTDAHGRKLVAATNKNGFTYAFDRANLSAGPLWEEQTGIGGECPPCGEGSVSSGAFGRGTLYMAGGHSTIRGMGYPGAVRAIDPATGKYLWEHGVPYPIVPALVYANGLIIDGEGSTMEVLDAATGTRLYSYETGDGIYGPASVSRGMIYMGSLDGYLYAFGLRSGPNISSDLHCLSGWFCQDLGSPRVDGSQAFSPRTWSIAAGGAGIGGLGPSYDQVRFVNQRVSGDTQITSQVLSQQEVGPASQAGLMVRQNTDRGSPFYAILLKAHHGLVVQYRTGFAGAAVTKGTIATATAPRYLEIQRIGDTFRAAVSTDGVTYTLVPGSTVTLVMPNSVLEGLVASSGVNTTLGTATYAHIAISKPDNAPVVPSPASPCPSGWMCSDVGNPALVGDQVLSNGTLSFQGAGKDIWGTADQFHFVWQSLPANSSVSTHITSLRHTDDLTKAGVMLRTNTDADALYYGAFITPHKGITVRYRTIKGLNAQIVTANSDFQLPMYLRVARWNNIFTTYVSTNGVTWNPLGGSSVPMDVKGPMLGGLAVTSHNIDTLSLATFDSFGTSTTAEPAPTACPDSWTCADIGYPAPRGSQLFNRYTHTWTLQGGGFDIFFKVDQFHYVWQPLSGDGAVSAQVKFVEQIGGAAREGNDYSKAGVMLRESTDPASPYYAAFITPQHGIMVQYRKKPGDGTGEAVLPDVPKGAIYLKVERSGNIFSAYTSKDDVTWTLIDGSNIEVDSTGTMLAGLAVTSHNPGALRVVTFDTVNIAETVQ